MTSGTDVDTSVANRILDAADGLFYAHGIQAVGIDRIRDAAQVSLKRLYQCYPSKAALVEAYLRRRDRVARAALAEYVAGVRGADDRVLGIYDWLYGVIGQPGFRGCAFNNAFGELGPGSEQVVTVVHQHKRALREYFTALVRDAGIRDAESVTAQLAVLFDGAITVGSIAGSPEAASGARAAASTILRAAARTTSPPIRVP